MPLAGRLLQLGLLGAIAAAVLGAEHIGHLTALADRLADISAQIRIRLTVLLAAGIALGAAGLGFEAILGAFTAGVLMRMLDPSPNWPIPVTDQLETISFGLLIPGAERSPTFRMPVSVRPPGDRYHSWPPAVTTSGALSVRVDAMESTVPNSPDSFADKANELVMSFDLTVDEARPRAAALQAIGAQWDPAVGLANELAAYGLLYSGLDGPHQRIYDDLVAAGVLPRGGAEVMLPIDPEADRSRRAWVACPACHHGDGCPDCETRRNCSVHWQYLLRNEGPRVIMQCPTCAHLWTTDTSRSEWRSDPSAIAHRKGA